MQKIVGVPEKDLLEKDFPEAHVMGWMDHLKTRFVRWNYGRIAAALACQTPEEMVAQGDEQVLRAFHRAALSVPAYGRFLSENGVRPTAIRTIDDFQARVPLIDKKSVFEKNRLRDLVAGGTLDDVRTVYTSSGHSGVFSYGIETWGGTAQAALNLEFLLDQIFQIFDRKSLLINCLPMGVKIQTRRLPVAETSVRVDVVHSLLTKLSPEFDQFILVGEHLFIKKVLEEGQEKGMRWGGLPISIVTGGEFIAENARAYLEHLLGQEEPKLMDRRVLVSMGISELSLSIFRETRETAHLRHLAQGDPSIRRALFGPGTEVCPLVMQYWPQQTFLETILGPNNQPELVVSTVAENVNLPLIRYRTGDCVHLLSYREFESKLKGLGREDLLPKWPLPVAFVEGRSAGVKQGDKTLSPNAVKEALYRDFALAGKVTGNFRISAEKESAKILVQLREGHSSTTAMDIGFLQSLKSYSRAEAAVAFVPYRQFPYGMELDYERKNRYL